jgi:hypothetical protein
MFKTQGMFLEKMFKKCYQIKSEFKCGWKKEKRNKNQNFGELFSLKNIEYATRNSTNFCNSAKLALKKKHTHRIELMQ